MNSVTLGANARTAAGTTAPVEAGALIATMPPAADVDGMQDLLAKVLATFSQMQRVQSDRAVNEVSVNETQRENAQHERDAALAEAKRMAEKGGVFTWVTEDIGLLGVAGLATFNYGLVAADIALHKSGLVDNLKLDALDAAAVALAPTHPEILAADILLRKLDIAPAEVKHTLDEMGLGTSVPGISDEDVKPIVDKAVTINLLVAGATASVLSAGSATALVVALIGVALSIGAYASQEAGGPAWLTIGLTVAGATCSFGAGLSSGAMSAETAARVAAAHGVSTGISATTSAMSGTDTIIGAVHQGDVDDATTSAQQARNTLAKLERILDGLIDALGDVQKSERRAGETVQGALQTHNQTLLLSASSVKG